MPAHVVLLRVVEQQCQACACHAMRHWQPELQSVWWPPSKLPVMARSRGAQSVGIALRETDAPFDVLS